MTTQRDATARLHAEFGTQVSTAVINAVVAQCAIDLEGVAATARPEMLERLCRQRLTFLDHPVAWTN